MVYILGQCLLFFLGDKKYDDPLIAWCKNPAANSIESLIPPFLSSN